MKIILGLLMMLASVAAHGQLLKCVGKDGRVEYASLCPPGTKEMQTGIKNVPSAAPAPAQQKSLAEREADFRKRQLEQGEARKKNEEKTAETAQKRQACESAQDYLKALQEGQRITRTDRKTGERIYLEDAADSSEGAKAERVVNQNCK